MAVPLEYLVNRWGHLSDELTAKYFGDDLVERPTVATQHQQKTSSPNSLKGEHIPEKPFPAATAISTTKAERGTKLDQAESSTKRVNEESISAVPLHPIDASTSSFIDSIHSFWGHAILLGLLCYFLLQIANNYEHLLY